MESLVLVLLYHSVCWLPHAKKSDLKKQIKTFFLSEDGKCNATINLMRLKERLTDFGLQRGIIRSWFSAVYGRIRKFYRARDDWESEQTSGPLKIESESMWNAADLKHDLEEIRKDEFLTCGGV